MRAPFHTAAIAVAIAAVAACSSSDENVCTPGAQVSCACTGGGQGVQVCAADGAALGPCDCGHGGTGGTGGSGGTGVTPCSPVAQTGCGAGEKCTYLHLAADVQAIGCAPDGTVGVGAACAYGPDGEATGYDSCAGGLLCVGELCKTICDHDVGTGCPEGWVCSAYSITTDLTAGACDPTCDPVTQRQVDGAAACGSVDPSNPDRGCYAQGDHFVCAGTAAAARELRHHDKAYGPPSGGSYINGCAPGYLPLFLNPDTQAVECVATCRPVESYRGQAAGIHGQSPDTCADHGAPGDAEECRFYWIAEAMPTAVGNTVGVCLDVPRYATPENKLMSCANLANTDEDQDGTADNLAQACAPYPL